MITFRTIVRFGARATLWSLMAFLALVSVWFCINRLLDAPPSAQQLALSVPPEGATQERRNIAVGILGLTAPMGSDFIEYGAEIKHLYDDSRRHQSQIETMMRGPKALRPTIDGFDINCWLEPDWPVFKGCLPFERAAAVIADNEQLLNRYRKLYDLEHYSAQDVYYNDAYLTVTRLVIADIQVDLRSGRPEAAYQKWKRQLRFVRANLRGPDTWVGKAISLVAVGMTLPVLDDLLLADPQIARTHAAELADLLRSEDIAASNPHGLVRAEFHLLQKTFEHPPFRHPEYGTDKLHWLVYHLGQKNRVLNRYAAFAVEYEAAMRLPWSAMQAEFLRLRERYSDVDGVDMLLDPFGTIFAVYYIESELKAAQFIRQMLVVDERLRLGTLLARLINENVPDANIPRFLASDRSLLDPFTGLPASWDPKDRKIYFLDPSEKCSIQSWFRVRDSRGSHERLPSIINTNAC